MYAFTGGFSGGSIQGLPIECVLEAEVVQFLDKIGATALQQNGPLSIKLGKSTVEIRPSKITKAGVHQHIRNMIKWVLFGILIADNVNRGVDDHEDQKH